MCVSYNPNITWVCPTSCPAVNLLDQAANSLIFDECQHSSMRCCSTIKQSKKAAGRLDTNCVRTLPCYIHTRLRSSVAVISSEMHGSCVSSVVVALCCCCGAVVYHFGFCFLQLGLLSIAAIYNANRCNQQTTQWNMCCSRCNGDQN